jgi:hypothetical protein
MQVMLAHDAPGSIIADITQNYGHQPAIQRAYHWA